MNLARLFGKQPAAARKKPGLWQWLAAEGRVATLIDIGANNGDFAIFIARTVGARHVIAFEPQPHLLPALQAKSAQLPNLQVHGLALSDETGTMDFFVNSSDPASSLLRIAKRTRTEFPATAGETATRVEVKRLDDVLDPAALEREIMIKMDVQGVEDRVIRGGRAVFLAARFVLVEMSFLPLYESQPLFEEVHAALAALGFRLAGFHNQIASERNGQPLFAHCLYARP